MRRRGGLPWIWGEPVTDTRLLPPVGAADARPAVRSIVVAAPAETVFGWGVSVAARAVLLYDWLDNFGRRSPREADPSLTGLEVGQSFMTIFELVGFAAPSSVRLRMQEGWPTAAFGAIDLTYSIEVADAERTRLSAVMWMPPIGRVLGRARRYLLAWGDLVMMRKQLRTLAALAERDSTNAKTRH